MDDGRGVGVRVVAVVGSDGDGGLGFDILVCYGGREGWVWWVMVGLFKELWQACFGVLRSKMVGRRAAFRA